MDFLKLVRARYSVRQYQNRPVEPEKVEQLLEAAQAAPDAASIMWSVRMDASMSVVCLPSKGRFHARLRSAHTTTARGAP